MGNASSAKAVADIHMAADMAADVLESSNPFSEKVTPPLTFILEPVIKPGGIGKYHASLVLQ